MIGKQPDYKENERTLVEKIPEDILRRTTFRKKKVSFKEEAEHLRLDQESEEWPKTEWDSEERIFPGSRKNARMTQRRVVMTNTVFA